MKETTIDQTLVLCDLDSLLLDAAGNLPQLQRDCLLYTSDAADE